MDASHPTLLHGYGSYGYTYDPAFVQTQAGHSYASTTSLYTSVSSDFKQKTVQQMIARRISKPEVNVDA